MIIRAAYVHTSSGLQEALRHRTRELKSREYGINLDLLTPEQVEKLQYIAQKYAALRKAMDSILEAGQKVQKMELNDLIQMELDAVKKIEESYEQQDPKAEEIKDELLTKAGEKEVQLSGLLESSLAQRIRLELSLVIALNILLKEEPKTAKLLNANPSLIGKMKNRILGLHEDVPDLILEQLKSTAFVPIRLQPRVFVLNFVGDMMASQVHTFREEVTALLSIADPTRDEVVIRLNSSGGTVTGYGLAAAQISRMREKGFKVNVAIDEVAASGGYMMAAVADKIYCSPFAVVGSIGKHFYLSMRPSPLKVERSLIISSR